jgi:hypothetical protein
MIFRGVTHAGTGADRPMRMTLGSIEDLLGIETVDGATAFSFVADETLESGAGPDFLQFGRHPSTHGGRGRGQ